MELLFNISEIAIITGDNPYKTKRDYLIDFWKKNAKNDYQEYIKLTQFVKETDDEVIKKITSKNNIDICADLAKCIKSNNTNDLNIMKKNILEKVSNLPEVEKREIEKSILNVTNTKFGIRNETDITKIYEKMTGQIITKDNKYKKINIFENKNYKISIGGKIDGINNESCTIIEVKNRMNKLFYELRNYEKVQIMCYMYLFQTKKGHLVEAHKKKDETNVNIIEVSYDEDYMKYIFEKLIDFSMFYIKFIENHDMKLKLLTTTNEIEI